MESNKQRIKIDHTIPQRYVIYYLIRVSDNMIFYVGKTTREKLSTRLMGHWAELNAKCCSAYKREVMNKGNRKDIEIRPIETIMASYHNDNYREKFWIQQFMRHGYKLANRTDYVNKYEFKYTRDPQYPTALRIGDITAPFNHFISHTQIK